MSQVSMIFGIAPAIAPVVGGWILGWNRWPMIFWFLVGFSALLMLVTWRALPETHPPEARRVPDARRLLRDYLAIFRSEEHTSELQSLMRISYAVFCLKKKKRKHQLADKMR